MIRVRTFLLGGFWLLVPLALAGQSPGLTEAERLLTEGRFAEARGVLERWYEAEGEGASRIDRQYAIWLRALLTTDPEVAELDYRRLVIEYPGGQYSDGALLRLAQGARAWGDLDAARRYLEILVRDYPQSPLRVEARTFLARLDQDPPIGGFTGLTGGTEIPASSATLTPSAPPGVPAAPPASPPPGSPVASALPSSGPAVGPFPGSGPTGTSALDGATADYGVFTLQLGAFSTEARAQTVAEDARSAGIQVRIVKVSGSDLIRVRHGAFVTREEAEGGVRALRALGFEAVISSDRDRELDG